ncbi:hypothetical protein EZV62_009580 [Acer yangbiense]|uniref:3-hydroxyisobutyryl-CoA hydrolase n=1 Tax=Acer yangbiense TaxID=1000413 RepID=A0A5C7I1J9_9ROSI|nr:hypothetical protein EZV62_009580 [Acer yangbiense]
MQKLQQSWSLHWQWRLLRQATCFEPIPDADNLEKCFHDHLLQMRNSKLMLPAKIPTNLLGVFRMSSYLCLDYSLGVGGQQQESETRTLHGVFLFSGEYLALTGEKLHGAEMIACGLATATHYTLSERLPLVEEQLGKLVTDDPSVIEACLQNYCDLVYPDQTSVLNRIGIVDKCFSLDSVEDIIDSLENEAARINDAWCAATLRRLKESSPLSLKVSLKSIREGKVETFDQCLVREYRMTLHALSKQVSGDICEGVRARMVDRDLAPKVFTYIDHFSLRIGGYFQYGNIN